MANELLSVKDVDRDRIRLLARREVTAVLRRDRRTWVHTVREEFATYYPLADLMRTQLRHDMEPIRFWRYGTHRYLENRQQPG